MANKTKTKTAAQTHQPAGRAIYRCRFCSQLFYTHTLWAAKGEVPINAWHEDSCLHLTTQGLGDFVALVFPGYPCYPNDDQLP